MKELDKLQDEANRLIDTVIPTDPGEEVRTETDHGEELGLPPVEEDMPSLDEVFEDG